jgi:predicted nicotinamide N-methyase
VTHSLTGAKLVADLERRFVTVNDDVRVGRRDINILRPRSAEDLISESDFDRDERLPYWAELWPSSTILANFVTSDRRPRGRAIELGAGVGLVSIAAALAGHEITASDCYEDARV